jgi:flagellar hook-basal body complex protein FliE
VAAIGGIGNGIGAAGLGQDHGAVRFKVGQSGSTSFADTLKNALGQASDLQDTAKDAIAAFLRGDPVEIHDVMAATEEAGIALDMLIEIRNKLTDAYRSVMQMQT